MIRKNYHTHTSRCGHARGTDEEYVLAAIKAGIRVLGFSDHAPYKEPFARERMDYSQYEDYKRSICSLKEKYKDQITIYCGMEVECYPSQWEDLMRYRKELDYCILGQHNLELDSVSSYNCHDEEQLMRYVDRLELAARSHLCDYIAHPDVILYSYPDIHDDAVHEAALRIADISLRYDMPLELNLGGIVYGKMEFPTGSRYGYPTRAFFKVFAQKHCPIIIGCDAHDPKVFNTDKYLDEALGLVSDLDLNFRQNYDIIAHAGQHKNLITPIK